MRIAIVHSFYSESQPSGENSAVSAQVRALIAAGHEVFLIKQETDVRQKARFYEGEASFTVATGVGRSPTTALRSLKPEITLVHNLFPNWGTRWLAHFDGYLAAFLHNFRPLCAAGTLSLNGQTCTRCPDGAPLSALMHKCYRNSRLATLPLVLANSRGLEHNLLLARAERLIALSRRSAATFERYGLSSSRVRVVPNFVEDVYGELPRERELGRWLYAGRLSPEKGLVPLLKHWPKGEMLDVIGSGPLMALIKAGSFEGVNILGSMSRTALLERLPRYRGLLFPSRCLEGAPMIVLEALSAGVPVVAYAGSSAADLVEDHDVGSVVRSDHEWSPVLRRVASTPGLRLRARRAYEDAFTPALWVDKFFAALSD